MRRAVIWIADIAIGVALLVAASSFWIARSAATTKPVRPTTPSSALLTMGSHLELPGLDFSKNTRTVLLFVSPGCGSCNDSVAFYRQLAAILARQSVPLVFVSDVPEQRLKDWTSSAGLIDARVVRYQAMSSLGVYDIPSLFVVNGKGIVSDALTRELSDVDSKRLLARLADPSLAPLDNIHVPPAIDLARAQQVLREQNAILLDVRARDAFRSAHELDARNIPSDELNERARTELVGRPVILECSRLALSDCRSALERLDAMSVRTVGMVPYQASR